jgi:hypothetical protein
MLYLTKNHICCLILGVIAILAITPAMAVDLICSGQQMGELFVDTASGMVTISANETLKVEVATENSNYRFEFKGKTNKFKAVINRTNGQIILDAACTPLCWGGPIYGNCVPVKTKF